MTRSFDTASATTLFWMLYAAVALPMLVGLLRGRAAWSRLLLWPLSAAVATALIGAAVSLVSHALAATVTARQTHLLVGTTLLLVPLIGYGLGRLAARTTPRLCASTRHARDRRARPPAHHPASDVKPNPTSSPSPALPWSRRTKPNTLS